MSSKRPRRNHAPEEKAAILRRHLVDKVPVSDLCDEHDVSPGLFYLWQRQAMERLEASFESGKRRRGSSRETTLAKEVARLKERLSKKDEVIAEISAEYIQAKKALGEP
jgi:transposase-like protein